MDEIIFKDAKGKVKMTLKGDELKITDVKTKEEKDKKKKEKEKNDKDNKS